MNDLNIKQEESIIGYMCFSSKKHRNGIPIQADGETVEYTGDLDKLISRGFYSCLNILDALYYGSTGEIFLTDSSGFVAHFEQHFGIENPRFVASKQTIIKRTNILDSLNKYLRDKAIEVAYLWEHPKNYQNTLLFLKGYREDLSKEVYSRAFKIYNNNLLAKSTREAAAISLNISSPLYSFKNMRFTISNLALRSYLLAKEVVDFPSSWSLLGEQLKEYLVI